MKKIALILAGASLAVTSAFGASVAGDNSSNYGGVWNSGDNLGFGFGAWTINNGDGGHYIGSTGLGGSTFGLFNTFTTTTTDAIRPFAGVLNAGDTFSINLGFSTFAASGSVGINLRSGTNEVITLFTNGSGDWMLNDGGSDFSAGAAALANSAYTFSLTYNGGSSYSFSLTGSVGGINFNSSNGGLAALIMSGSSTLTRDLEQTSGSTTFRSFLNPPASRFL